MDPNWDFWFENKPSGNPGQGTKFLGMMFSAFQNVVGLNKK
jgi:hypothetical protein